jgi:uncharacterized protein DUF4255
MSDYTVIGDVTSTVLTLFKNNTGGLLPLDRITTASPADISDDTQPLLSFFLYQIIENPHLKNEGMLETDAGLLRYPPLALNLHYLLTAYASSRETEHQILGRAMQILHDNAILRGSLLQGSLASTFEEVLVAINALTLDDTNKLWSLFSSKPYRLSVSYRLSTVLIDSTRERAAGRVIQRSLGHTVR